jgi:hypothetical protein
MWTVALVIFMTRGAPQKEHSLKENSAGIGVLACIPQEPKLR